VYIVATEIGTTAILTIIITTIGRIVPTGRIDPTDRCDRLPCLHKDQGAAWVVPPEYREAVVAVAVAVARFGLAQDIYL